MASIVFFNLDEWEVKYLKKRLKGHKVSFVDDQVQDVPEKAKSADIVGVFIHSEVNKRVLSKLKKAKCIVTLSTGFDHIDLKECKKRKITVCNVPSYGENTVAEHAMGLLLTISKKIHESVERTRKGDFRLEGLRGFDLKGKTLGIIGTGRIGRHMAKFAQAFEMDVIAYDHHPNKEWAKESGVKYTTFNKVLSSADVLSLHVPETKETHHLINKKNLKKVKKGCVLINTARGGLVETGAILEGLDKGIFAACGLDVLEGECAISEEKELVHTQIHKKCDLKTILEDHLLLRDERVFVTPHNAFNTEEALQRILDTTVENIKRFLKGEPKNVVR